MVHGSISTPRRSFMPLYKSHIDHLRFYSRVSAIIHGAISKSCQLFMTLYESRVDQLRFYIKVTSIINDWKRKAHRS
jgi:hypothetical protein